MGLGELTLLPGHVREWSHRDIYYAKYYGKDGQPGKKMKLGVKEKNEKGERKRRKITLKKGKEALKMHLHGL